MAIATNIVAITAICASAISNINERLEASDPDIGMTRFLGYPADAAESKFRPNPKFWARDIDFSCASPWNSSSGALRAGTLISRRHIVFAKHFPLAPKTRLLFVGADGCVCPVRLMEYRGIPGTDIVIGLLDVEVTPNIHPAKILPPDAEKYIGTGEGLPVGIFTQQEKMYLAELNSLPTDGPRWSHTRCRIPKSPLWCRFRGRLIGGDSGNPAFLILGNEAILLYCATGGWSTSGPGLHNYAREIQAAMDTLCPGYKLQYFDFSTPPPSKSFFSRLFSNH